MLAGLLKWKVSAAGGVRALGWKLRSRPEVGRYMGRLHPGLTGVPRGWGDHMAQSWFALCPRVWFMPLVPVSTSFTLKSVLIRSGDKLYGRPTQERACGEGKKSD